MNRGLNSFDFVVIAIAGWMNQRQRDVIDYLREENYVLREQLGEGACGLVMINVDGLRLVARS